MQKGDDVTPFAQGLGNNVFLGFGSSYSHDDIHVPTGFVLRLKIVAHVSVIGTIIPLIKCIGMG